MKNLSDQKLLEKTKALVAQERETLKEVLEHLQEIYERRLFADLGYSSLYKYLVKELKYSEGAAGRRVAALKLVKKVPEAKTMIARGELNLSLAWRAQSFTEKKDVEETKDVLKRIMGKTKDEAEKELFKMTDSDTPGEWDLIKRVGVDKLRLQLIISDGTKEKLELVKDYYKCSSDRALALALGNLLKQRESKLHVTKKVKLVSTVGRSIPMALKKKVLLRAGSRCEFPGCQATRQLEFEHIIPFGKGGKHKLSNLKLYCRAHNQRSAIAQYGQAKMNGFLN